MASSSSPAAAVTDASFLNAADQYEELKAADLETGGSASTSILPLEIEDGAAAKKGEKAEGGKVLEADGATAVGTPTKPKGGFCARHWGKFLCAGITLAILAAAAIATPLLWYKEPTAELLSQSNLRIDGTGSLGVDLKLKITNPNRYPVAFQNLRLDILNLNGVNIGQVTRKERQRVPARGSVVTTAKATIQASIIELFAMGIDCLANDNHTKLTIRGTADGRLSGKRVKQVVGPFVEMTQCVTLNVGRTGGAGAGAGGGAAGGAGGQQPGIGNGQIIQEIGNAIQGIFGGGRPQPAGGAGAATPPAAAAPAPGAN